MADRMKGIPLAGWYVSRFVVVFHSAALCGDAMHIVHTLHSSITRIRLEGINFEMNRMLEVCAMSASGSESFESIQFQWKIQNISLFDRECNNIYQLKVRRPTRII